MTTQPGTTQPSADGVFVTQRQLPFAASQIFAAFANADQLAAWWWPEGFRNAFEVFEFKPHGRWTFVMHGQDGASYPNDCVFLETAPQRVVIRHVCAPYFTLTVTWAQVAATGHTNLSWHQALDDPSLAASIAHIIVPANEQNIDRLQAVLLAAGVRASAADNTSVSAGCFCSAVKLQLTGKPKSVANCHCGECRRLSGSAFTTWAAFNKATAVITGADRLTAFQVTPNVCRYFCSTCGSHVYTSDERFQEILGVPAGALASETLGLSQARITS